MLACSGTHGGGAGGTPLPGGEGRGESDASGNAAIALKFVAEESRAAGTCTVDTPRF